LKPAAVPNLIAFLMTVCLACLPLQAGAAGDTLFVAEVEVADASAAVRGEGIIEAFAAVLIKVTGRADPKAFPVWPNLRSAADGLLLEYRYRTVAAPVEEGPLAPARTLLTVRFDRQGVESLLRTERLPLWGDTRPATLLLIAVERGIDRFIYTPDALPEAATVIATASNNRGIPLLEPLMDLEDRATLQFTEVWAGFPEVIERTAARYGPDAVLVARLFSEGPSAWRAQWTLHLGRERVSWQSRGGLTETLQGGIGELANRLALRYVPDPATGEQQLALVVAGISSPADYARVMSFLGGLTAVTAVHPRIASREELEIELVTDVAPESLLRTIGLGDTLTPTISPGQNLNAIPRFRLRQ